MKMVLIKNSEDKILLIEDVEDAQVETLINNFISENNLNRNELQITTQTIAGLR